MDWEAIGAVAGLLGTLGTVIGLVFVYRELRNVRQNQYAEASQRIVDSERELWSLTLADEQMTYLMAEHLGLDSDMLQELELTPAIGLKLLLFFRQYENMFYQHDHDMLPEGLWEHWKSSMRHTFSDSRVQEVLRKAQIGYSDDFKEFLQEVILPHSSAVSGLGHSGAGKVE